MKNRLIIFLSALLIAPAFMTGCIKGDGEQDYGYGYVLLPQSQTLDGYYAVPSGEGEYTYNFKVEGGKVLVFMGVLRSGNIPNEGFSVTVGIDPEEAQRFVNKTVAAELMPASMYTLPQTVEVPGDSNQALFNLELDAAALQEAAYDGKKLVVSVTLSNPTKFLLSPTAATATVVVDVNKIRVFI